MKSRERLTAGLEPDAEVRFFGGGQTLPSREDSDKETEMNVEYRKDRKFQAMGKMNDLEASYAQLVALFDEPNAGPSPDGKIQIQWDMIVNGVKVSVWNWKDKRISHITSWSIWAEDGDAIEELQDFFARQSDYSVEGWEASGGWVDPNEPMSEQEELVAAVEAEGIENEMLETVREEISHMNQESDGGYFLAVAEVLGRYIVRSLNADGKLVEQALKEFYEEITD